MKPEIILTAAGHAGTQATLMAEFDAHKFWEAPDKKQFVEQHRGARGLATFGPMTVDGRFMDQFPKLEIIANFGVGVDAINLIARAVQETGATDSVAIIGNWDKLTNYPGLFATYSFSRENHNGLPMSDLVMSEANSQRLGAYKLAPGYT